MSKDYIKSFIDFFYPPFKKLMNIQTFRYAACGGTTMLVDIAIFFISFHYILHEKLVNLGFYVVTPYSAALLMAFCISFPMGFLLSKHIVFHDSPVRGRVQLIRYMLVVMINLAANWAFIKVMVEYWHFYPTIARIFTVAILVTFSYLTQKHFTFKSKPEPALDSRVHFLE